MQVEHLTLGGNSAVRDTAGIYPETIELLKDFQIAGQVSKVIPFPRTSLEVKVTSTKEGAVFDIMKGNRMGVVNVCCFDSKETAGLMELVGSIYDMIKMGSPRLPILENWIYSLIVDPMALSREEIITAGEVELYIYYSLYLGRQ